MRQHILHKVINTKAHKEIISFVMFYFNWHYFLKMKYTARTRKQKPMRWFMRNVSFLKAIIVNIENTVIVMTSCMTFSCQRLNGPPFSMKPILLAGTWKQYSKKAIPQLIRIIANKGRL